ncbi:FAD/NAD(P)-binding domain-containing protein [Melanomma pulvis-pyrius CBS 109.77]|uniref:FAD/NAD(P)-binding domain-containing protein n=1 Tax=Melanomma pulvis-pyrius CBS 109.77 TaxID=1314802 RepID=A0A6A6WT18_9PLEO|nr:FAD/NAD(P)-binding domain-containing protein [Melanomma pulvis-pyrius CBS 109.77]
MAPVKRVAVIGLGPGGAITIDALVKETAFDVIRVFERREAPGGCWVEDQTAPPNLTGFSALAARNADLPVALPSTFPTQTPKSSQPRHAESSVYPYLETNVDSIPMEFSQEPIPEKRSALSISKHGEDTPFRHHSIIQRYIAGLVDRNEYQKLVSYNTTVEKAEKIGSEWKLILRRQESGSEKDFWWVEWFDAVIVASGHYHVPYIPKIEGLEEFEQSRPGSVKHSKMFRGREAYHEKRVVVVGASVSAADIAVDLIGVARGPVFAVIEGHNANGYFGDEAFKHPGIESKPSICHVDSSNGRRTVHFIDGTSVADVDEILFGTGYSWSIPFLPNVEVRNNRIPNLYLHVVYQNDPSLLFVGAVGAGLTFKVFEWQAVLAARVLSGRAALPPLQDQIKWEEDRIAKRGDGAKFTLIFPDFEEYFETLRQLAGDPKEIGVGRRLPPFNPKWYEVFMKGHETRKEWWKRENAAARKTTERTQSKL